MIQSFSHDAILNEYNNTTTDIVPPTAPNSQILAEDYSGNKKITDEKSLRSQRRFRSRTRKSLRQESVTYENESIISYNDNFFDDEEKSQLISDFFSGGINLYTNSNDESSEVILAPQNKPIDEIWNHLKNGESLSEMLDYAHENYGNHKTNTIFNKKQISKNALISFTNEPISEPLHKNLNKNLHKLSLECFKKILKYTGVIKTKNTDKQIDGLISILYDNNELIDEVYCQLMKQSTHTPNNQMLENSMKLFVIISSIFPPTENVRCYVRTFLIKISKHPDLIITAYSEFALIRFYSRCSIGTILNKQELPPDYIKRTFTQLSMGCQVFGTSIYEMMWNQRNKYPNLPIPYIQHYFSDSILNRGGTTTVGLFRLSGKQTEVVNMIEKFNKGVYSLHQDTHINDICSAFKTWLRDMPIPIVPPERYEEIFKVTEANASKYIEIAESILKAHKNVLKHLVGFLQKLCTYEETTKMNAKNLAIIFGPNLIQRAKDTDINLSMTVPNNFLLYLIENWDTSDIYPLSEKHFK